VKRLLGGLTARMERALRDLAVRMLNFSNSACRARLRPEEQRYRKHENVRVTVGAYLSHLRAADQQQLLDAICAVITLGDRTGLAGEHQATLRQDTMDAIFRILALGKEHLNRPGRIEVLLNILANSVEEGERFQLPLFQARAERPLNTWIYQNERLQLDIRPGERVLDIGSGGWPFSRATHLADLYPGATTHRVEQLRIDGRPFYVIDIHNMPFRDETWDFTFCSHVLEHLENPGHACRELMRVSKRGYIEVPTRLSDVMLNFTRIASHHRYHGLVLGDTLVLIEWTDAERRDVGTNFFFQCLHSHYVNPFQKMFEDNWKTFYAMLPWEGRFNFLIVDGAGRVVDSSRDL
jgi:SAM-dependent methyltransferase